MRYNARPSATRLRELRRSRGMRQRDLADVVGVHVAAVSLWERGGTSPYPRTARRLEAIFGEPIEALIAPENENENEADATSASTP